MKAEQEGAAFVAITGVDLKEKFEGKIKLSGIQKIDDAKVDITMSGPLTGNSTTKIKQ